MTHDELLARIDSVFYEEEGGLQLNLADMNNQHRALRAIVEYCIHWSDWEETWKGDMSMTTTQQAKRNARIELVDELLKIIEEQLV